ncbi:hypothetical protein [Mucilaginibacter sp.]|uniref:hypothetical protein n=1 Tax=Mucilaginibacter sp. TaxID=1882438 RepID=UPI002B922F65|nr:hypothetical protein [Mucilaginibacter sp.]HTI59702.1 hypothetical protein [Mucilaginibacter sp.]
MKPKRSLYQQKLWFLSGICLFLFTSFQHSETAYSISINGVNGNEVNSGTSHGDVTFTIPETGEEQRVERKETEIDSTYSLFDSDENDQVTAYHLTDDDGNGAKCELDVDRGNKKIIFLSYPSNTSDYQSKIVWDLK